LFVKDNQDSTQHHQSVEVVGVSAPTTTATVVVGEV